ncbi:MAG: ThiF family adenylyltransferase, partial [Lachnospiraceae bacterium]|nr:ThiF family adenylyltransferase [Lachnospiraceae bacterium]
MNEIFIRTAQILGEDGFQKLQTSAVAVFGLGGVGSHCAEALARSGVGTLFLIDSDVVAPSNINRQ